MSATNTFKIEPVRALKDNYIWLVINKEKQMCVIVDPGESAPVLNWLQTTNLKPIAILLTHHHGDHSGGVDGIVSVYDISVYASKLSRVSAVTHHVDDGDIIHFEQADMAFDVIAIPGHTLDHTAYVFQNNLFCGDTLFSGGCGRVFEGTYEQMYTSLKKLMALADETKVYCGHEYTLANLRFVNEIDAENPDLKAYLEQVKQWSSENKVTLPSTLALEKKINPFLRCENQLFVEQLETLKDVQFNNAVDVFTYLRELKNNF